VFLVGDAFGSGVACQVAGARPDEVNGLLLVEPFDNFINVVWSHFPVFPMHHLMEWFMYDQYDSDSALKGYDGPVAVVIAGKEQVVPPELGEALFDGYHGTKRIWVLDDDDHDALVTGTLAGWWQEAFGFLKKYAVVTKG
jgi:pimeloyl-ACP methyl ester carboxylesterase